MHFTVSFGWWLFPVAVSITAFAVAYGLSPHRTPPTGYGNVADAIISLVIYGVAAIISLTVWLVWALLT